MPILLITLAKLEPPPIGHPVYPITLTIGLIIGLLAIRPAMRLRDGPQAAWAPIAPSPVRLALAAAAIPVLGLVGFLAIFGLSWPPISAERRTGWALAALAMLAAPLALTRVFAAASNADRPGARLPAWLVVAALSAALGLLYALAVLWTRFVGPAADADARLTAAISALIAATAAASIALPLSAFDRRTHGFSAAFILAGMLLTAAGALLGSGSIAFGQIALAIACPTLALALASAITRGGSIGAGALAFGAAALVALLIGGQAFSRLPWHSGLIIASAPSVAYSADALLAPRLPPRAAALVRILAAAIVAGAGMASAITLDKPADAYEY